MSQIPVTINIGAAAVYPATTFIPVQTTINAGRNPDNSIIATPVNMIALQFTYVSNAVWVVSATGQLQGRFDAIRGFYVDNTGANNDVLIVNVTTGFQIRVPARSSGFYPFLAGQGDISFYLQNTGGTSPTEFTNVYALDTGPSPANYPEYQRVLSYGVGNTGNFVPVYGSTDIHGNPVPVIVANQTIRTGVSGMQFLPMTPTGTPFTGTTGSGNEFISTNNWYIESVYFWLASNGNASTNSPYGVTLYDGSTPFLDLPTSFVTGSNPASWSITGLNYKSLGTGPLSVCSINSSNAIFFAFNAAVSY